MPVGLVVAGANRPDMKLVKDTVDSVVVKRPCPTQKRPQGMCLDKGYDGYVLKSLELEGVDGRHF